jgi:phage terminase large subunit
VRSEAVYVCRDWLRAGGCLPRDGKLEGEMAALKFTFDQRNRLKILGKDELRKELGRSTDRFDALALAVYAPSQARVVWDDDGEPSERRYHGGSSAFDEDSHPRWWR